MEEHLKVLDEIVKAPLKIIVKFNIKKIIGAPGWFSRLSGRLRLRSRSRGLRVRAPRRALG